VQEIGKFFGAAIARVECPSRTRESHVRVLGAVTSMSRFGGR
jgi:hypothetical protein